MNVKHARRLAAVKGRIREEPRRFNMDHWATPSEEAPCGTAACIAGHVVWRAQGWTGEDLLATEGKDGDYIRKRAQELLGLSYGEAVGLFLGGEWPEDLAERHELSDDPKERAEIACQAIDRFLAERGFDGQGERVKEGT